MAVWLGGGAGAPGKTGGFKYGQATPPPDLRKVIAIAAGSTHSLALTSDGTVVAWGHNGQRQTNVPPTLTGVVAIAAGMSHSLALKSNGRVVAWGSTGYGEGRTPPDLRRCVAIAAGFNHNIAIVDERPHLNVQLTGNGLSLSWLNFEASYHIESSPMPTTGNAWVPAAGTTQTVGIEKVLTTTHSDSQRFFRLKKLDQ